MMKQPPRVPVASTWIYGLIAGLATTFPVHDAKALGVKPSDSVCKTAGLAGPSLAICWAYDFGKCNLENSRLGARACSVLETRFLKVSRGKDLAALFSGAGVSKTISAAGGSVDLPGVASVHFPANAFDSDTTVRISKSSEPQIAEIFDEFASIFRPVANLGYEIRVNTGPVAPSGTSVDVDVLAPDDLLQKVQGGQQIEAFVVITNDGGEETYNSFELVPASYDSGTKRIQVTVPAAAFTDQLSGNGTFELIVTLAITPGVNRLTPTQMSRLSTVSAITAQASGTCKAAAIGCPVAGGCTTTSEFSQAREHPTKGGKKPHNGVDLRAPTGTTIVAAADGTVEKAYKSTSYGETIVIRHDDGSATLYAHLESRAVGKDTRVSKGQAIGVSDNTGESSGPHLHFEYVPNGEIIQSKERIDPGACIDETGTARGSITLSDNGSLADDAFSATLDGISIGSTEIGQANTLAVSNLIPGPHTLGVTAVVAPDNVGTLLITLSDGLTFSGGGTSVSDVLSEGETRTYGIVAPNVVLP